jgi:hypothetical protein
MTRKCRCVEVRYLFPQYAGGNLNQDRTVWQGLFDVNRCVGFAHSKTLSYKTVGYNAVHRFHADIQHWLDSMISTGE